jgi:hypothetical protein
MSATAIFDPLKARIIDEDSAKTLHVSKKVPGVIIHFPGQNIRLLNSSMLRIFEDFNKTKLIGYGILAYEDTKEFKGTILDLYLNYNLPVRLDLENGATNVLYVLYDTKKANDYATLNCVLDNGTGVDNISSSVMFEFPIGKENLCS